MNFIKIREAYETIIAELVLDARDDAARENFKGSGERVAKSLTEMCLPYDQIEEEIAKQLKATFPTSHNEILSWDDSDPEGDTHIDQGMVTQGPIKVTSMCPHHLLPVIYEVYVAYIPIKGKVLGLSKLTRICVELGRRPILQEQLAIDIANTLYKFKPNNEMIFESAGSAVQPIGLHNCMVCRGVKQNPLTAGSVLRGTFRKEGMESKFFQQISVIRQSFLNTR